MQPTIATALRLLGLTLGLALSANTWAAEGPGPAAATTLTSPEQAERAASALQAQCAAYLAAAPQSTPSQQLDELAQRARAVARTQPAWRAQQASATTPQLPPAAAARQQQMAAQLATRSQQLQTLAQQLAQAASARQAEPTRALARQVLDLLGPTTPAPTFKPNWKTSQAPQATHLPHTHPAQNRLQLHARLHGPLRLAAAGSLSGIELPEADDLAQPTAADLAFTPLTQPDAALIAQVAELAARPVAIQNWVRNNIRYVPGWGVTQTAAATYAQRQGNAYDIATLLVSMLRQAQVPARYVYGTVEMPAAVAQRWLGTDLSGATQLMASAGVPSRLALSAGGQSQLQLEHVWVEAWVPGVPSRGGVRASAQVAADSWWSLDAAFKTELQTPPQDLVSQIGLNPGGVLDALQAGATCTVDYAQSLNLPALQSAYSAFRQRASGQLASSGSAVSALLGQRQIQAQNYAVLLGTQPYAVTVRSTGMAELPAALRHRLRLQLGLPGLPPVVDIERELSELQGQRLTLAFAPETADDTSTLAALLPGGGALPLQIPAYLVRVKAELRLNGQLLASGGSWALGETLALQTTLGAAGGALASSGNSTLVAGELHAWAINPQGYGEGGAEAAAQRLNALKARIDTNQLAGLARHDAAGDTLAGLATAYAAGLDASAKLFQRAAGMREHRLPTIVRAVSRLEPGLSYGVVSSVRAAGVALVADRLASAVAPASPNSLPKNLRVYAQQSLERSSAAAHQLLEQVLGDNAADPGAHSALKDLARATAAGQRIYRIDAANATTALPQLSWPENLKAGLAQATSDGLAALVAQNPVTAGGLSPLPAVVEEPASGAGSYTISGSQAPWATATGQLGGSASTLGWLGLLDSSAAAPQLAPALAKTAAALNTSRAVLGDIDGIAWPAFVARDELIDTLFSAALNSASTGSACDWLGSLLASQLGSGLVLSNGVNHAPEITSVPVTYAAAGSAYSYAVTAVDADGNPLRYALQGVEGPVPTGLAISPAGLISWSAATPGSYALVVRVDDGVASAEQRYTLTVGSEPAPLELQVALLPSIANAGEVVTLTVLASGGNGGAITKSASLNGNPLTLSPEGVATFAAPAAGVHRVQAQASAAPAGGSAPPPQTRELLLTVRDTGDTTPPVAAITSPEADAEVTSRITVTGTATDAAFAYYQLLLRPADTTGANPPWTEITRGLAPVTAGALGSLDPSTLANGEYQLGLRVVDVNGQQNSVLIPIEITRERKLGPFRISFTDVRTDAVGLPLLLTRSYDSTKKDISGDFGWGWFASANDVSLRKNMVLGSAWQVQPRQLQLCIVPAAGKRRVTVTLPDGGVYRFQARNEPECAFGTIPPLNIVMDPLPLPVGGSAGSSAGTGQLEVILTELVQAQGGHLITDVGDIWNPRDFKFTTPEGFKYILREGVGVIQVTDPYGNTVSYGPNGYQHSASIGIELTRDAQGRITKATDPQGKSLSYAYNAQGELSAVTDRLGQTTRFDYGSTTLATAAGSVNNRHLLTRITDPRGQVVLQSQFDEYGRLTAAADAQGQSAQQSFDEANSQMRVVDRRGNPSTYTFDAQGNVTRIQDALNGNTELSYDANGNELTRTDPLGHTHTKTYDPLTGTALTETDPLGRTTTTAYPTVGREYQRRNPLSVTDPKGNVTRYGYDSGQEQQPGAVPSLITEPLGRTTAIGLDTRGNLRTLNVAGITTSYEYDTKGRRTKETDGLGKVTSYSYDDNGNELTRTVTRTVGGVTRTETTTRTYDAENRVASETDATGATRHTTYNKAGKVETSTDALGRITRHSYDANARLTKTEHPDGTSESTSYDANGNETSRTDRQGRTTRMEYDALNRHVKTTHPDGTSESTEYDAAGRVTASVDAQGARQTSEYDAAGQQTASVDASGRRTEHSYDVNGNRTQTRLPDGRLIKQTYDELNRLTSTEYPDGSTHSISYRPDGRKQSETDPRGTTSTYGYDAKGQLTSVVQSGITTATTYAYDEQGAKATQKDALGREVKWTYDPAGRPTSRTLPDGSKESFQYDLEGQLIARTTFGGHRIQSTYDAAGREITRIIPATAEVPARTIQWTYDQEGRRLTQTESGETSSQGTTTYKYDAKGRLIEQAMPQGTLSWAYDNQGRVTERTTSEGTTRYVYDGDGRMTQLTAPDGKTVVYTYDAAGRNTRTVQQLNPGIELVTDKRFDNQDRQTHIAHSKQTSTAKTLIAGQAIVRGQGGAVQRLETYDEQAGFDEAAGGFTGSPSRVQAFAYDANARLTSEKEYKGAELQAWLTNNQAQATKATTYGYDSVGNRVSKVVTTPAGTESTSYSYDTNDRLTTETLTTATGSTVTTTYTWDTNGNMASKASPGEYSGYIFDADNRLIEVKRGPNQAAASSVAKYSYDADGQRIRRTSPVESTRFLIDPTTMWPQAVLEVSEASKTIYVWGVGLARQASVSAASVEDLAALPGHLGTNLAGVGMTGVASQEYEASAWGELANSWPSLKHQYVGEHWDGEAGLTYLRARWYAAGSGRLISRDAYAGREREPCTANAYSYTCARPTDQRDPSGMFGIGEFGAAESIRGTLAGLQAESGFNIFDGLANQDTDVASAVGIGILASLLPRATKFLGRSIESRFIGAGKVAILRKFKPLPKETAAAEHLAEKIGAKIYIRGGKSREGADFFMNGQRWELKVLDVASTNPARGVDSGIKAAIGRNQSTRVIVDGRAAGMNSKHFDDGIRNAIRDRKVPSEVIGIDKNGAILYWP